VIDDLDDFVRRCRDVLEPYGKNYSIGAVRGLAVRHMMSVRLPEPEEGFYPIVKVHDLALRDLEEVFYRHVRSDDMDDRREELIQCLVDRKVWE